ncbi:spore germination protein [Paenibacillus sp. 5J-6]|uniref:Spore germination protein n=1 Tax=Paenibacillus silvestris TaxID=2606219 RepID=A0A6L8V9Q5_9BACL|nr:spore germination protein [Paenibacillus silvestris]MZQ86336.1 spore germination protein [Paenibacillus silvestris]
MHIEADMIIKNIAQDMGNPPDLSCLQLTMHDNSIVHCLYLASITMPNQVDELILKPLITANQQGSHVTNTAWLLNTIPLGQRQELDDFSQAIHQLLNGHCLLMLSTENKYLSFDVSKSAYRSIEEPSSEVAIRGPREGFVEDISQNIPLIRKRLKSKHLVFEKIVLGTQTQTTIYITYLSDVASTQVVDEFRRRISSIETDSVLESAYIEEWIQDKTFSPFPQLITTERPDSVVAKLLEGQVAVLTDGTPMALLGPVTFFQFFTSPEDHYQRADIATLIRWLRMFTFLLAIFTPALYVSIVSYHQELLPTSLLINLSAQREQVPFPAFVEATIMMITFEILREAGLRMPRIAGQAISIVGALVLGQAAVEAGLISAAMVIVVSLTAISNFISPSYSFGIAQRIIQFSFLGLSSVLGLFGLLIGVYILLVHLASLRSFGIHYLSPVSPLHLSAWKDTIIRVPRFLMNRLPRWSHDK